MMFPCQIKGLPTPDVRWFKDDVELEGPTHSNYLIHFDNVLELRSVQFSDFGRYKCKALNKDRVKLSRTAHLTQDSDAGKWNGVSFEHNRYHAVVKMIVVNLSSFLTTIIILLFSECAWWFLDDQSSDMSQTPKSLFQSYFFLKSLLILYFFGEYLNAYHWRLMSYDEHVIGYLAGIKTDLYNAETLDPFESVYWRNHFLPASFSMPLRLRP